MGANLDLFHAALEVPLEQRDGFVEAACGADHPLREGVKSLLVSHLQSAGPQRPEQVLLAESGGQTFRPRFSAGTALGRFEILEFLVAGGISEVYRARDARLGTDRCAEVL